MRQHIAPGDPLLQGRDERLMGERSIGDLFADLTRELTTLVRQEMALATTELGHKATRVGRHLGFLALGGAVAYAGFLALVAALIALFVALSDDEHTLRLTGAVGERRRPADHLIGVFRVNSEEHRELDRLVELRVGNLL